MSSENETPTGLPFMRSTMASAVNAVSETIHLLYDLKSPDEAKIIKIKNNLIEVLMLIYADETMFIESQQMQTEDDEEDSTIH